MVFGNRLIFNKFSASFLLSGLSRPFVFNKSPASSILSLLRSSWTRSHHVIWTPSHPQSRPTAPNGRLTSLRAPLRPRLSPLPAAGSCRQPRSSLLRTNPFTLSRLYSLVKCFFEYLILSRTMTRKDLKRSGAREGGTLGGVFHGARAHERGQGACQAPQRRLQQGHGPHVGVAHEEKH